LTIGGGVELTRWEQPVSAVADERMSDADGQVALQRLVKRSGFTLADLRRQGSTGEFNNLQARVAWIAVRAIEGD
jgi:hypothetical protein